MPELAAHPHVDLPIPAISLSGEDLIVDDPDHPGTPVLWQIYHREVQRGATPTELIVIVDYKAGEVDGRHEFEDPQQDVTVRIALGAAA
jgi:hypothetical protein